METSRYLDGIGLCVPKVIESREQIKSDQKYIIKPRKSNGSKGLIICSGSEIKEMYFSDTSVIQEYIEGDEYTVGLFKNKDVVNSIIFKRRLKNGYSNYVELTREKALNLIKKNGNIKDYLNKIRTKDNTEAVDSVINDLDEMTKELQEIAKKYDYSKLPKNI